MSKLYFCNTIGDGTQDNPFSPAITKYTTEFSATDARSDATQHGSMMVVCKDITDDEHNLAITDIDITYINLESTGLNDRVNIGLQRKELNEKLKSEGIDIQGLSHNSTLRDILSYTVSTLLKRQNPNHITSKNHYDNN